MHDYDRSNKTAAEEIPLDQLPAAQAKLVKKLEGKFGPPARAWEGIHGIIVEWDSSMGGGRLAKDTLKLMVSDSKFRWVDADSKRIAVGM